MTRQKDARAARRRVARAIEGLGPFAPVVTDRGEVLSVIDLRALLAEAARCEELERAGSMLLESLGEYVRQSMYENPEWRSGINAMIAALSPRQPKRGKASKRRGPVAEDAQTARVGHVCENCRRIIQDAAKESGF